ncbi:Gfo/Idh/MocA family oxidoreductase [Flavobacterium algicola]|uniref:Gfo/Idh/MocA family oxidoreductase n=1 Tax=Flavobacterium algicola TaxID=556529 RepID=UPI001EFDBBCD|nr:Gfo/Idh/MocA family oxidoreductase [Flavobacterium algicola]MCG9792014.1 Gfo/Idh/MocA family oxidoreductase [Flavobacterium algicola]
MQKIKTALLSYGMSGKVFHAPFLTLHPGFELIGAWERSKKLMQVDYPEAINFPTLESVLESEVALVVINTPTAHHYEHAKKVLLSGKHAIVEKAFTTTVAEAQELAAIAKEKGLKLAVFQNRRWDSDFKTVKKVRDDGLLGDLIDAEFHFDRYTPALSPKAHKETVNPGAGIVKDLGSHLIDQALTLFGFPQAVNADIRITREHSVVDDSLDINLFYPNLRVRLKAGYFNREMIPSFILQGKQGSFFKQRGDVQEDQLKLNHKPNLSDWGTEADGFEGLVHTEIDGEVVRKNIPTLKGNYYDYFDGMYNAIANNTAEPVTAQDGIHVMQIIEAAMQSSKEKRRIEF